ncbi:MAG: hypothetical protein HZC17_02185 [Candidatus Omnitrophica bacterium]|nr:hypothetical protein [Candidatus Omnitrophota bacterium]
MTLRNKSISIFTSMALAVSLFAVPTAIAQESVSAQISVIVALAIPGGDKVDPRLSAIESELNNTFRKSSYEQLEEMRFDLASQQIESRPLPGGGELGVQLVGADPGRFTLNVTIISNGTQVLNTNFTIARGGTIIVGGPSYKEGNLVLAIKASGK